MFLLGQAWWLEPLLLVLQPYRSKLQIVNYMPIEGDLTDLEAARTVGLVDHCILYTEFARNNRAPCAKGLSSRIFSFVPQSFTYCPMELIQRRFGHYSGASVARQGNCSRLGVREKLFPGLPLVHTGFLVLNANRPSHRKRLDITLKGFAQFAEGKPENVFIYLHQTSTDDYTNQRMRRLVVTLPAKTRSNQCAQC